MQDILEPIKTWADTHHAVVALALVGSHARGQATPESDVDLIVVSDDPDALLGDTSRTAQFGLFVADAGYDPDWECITWDFEEDAWGARGTEWSWDKPGIPQDDTHPVLCVSYTDAVAYVEWLSAKTDVPYRLLTDVEWEYIARDGSQEKRPWPEPTNRSAACAMLMSPTR